MQENFEQPARISQRQKLSDITASHVPSITAWLEFGLKLKDDKTISQIGRFIRPPQFSYAFVPILRSEYV